MAHKSQTIILHLKFANKAVDLLKYSVKSNLNQHYSLFEMVETCCCLEIYGEQNKNCSTKNEDLNFKN